MSTTTQTVLGYSALFLLGFLIGYAGTELFYKLADLVGRPFHPGCAAEPDEDGGWWIDEGDRDAIGRLIAAGAKAYNAAVLKNVLALEDRAALDGALEDAEERFGQILEDADQEHPAHTVTVTQLEHGDSARDLPPNVTLVYTGAKLPVSYLVTHPAACDHLPYGARCWYDELSATDGHEYDAAPGTYTAEFAVELNEEREYVHFEPTIEMAAG
jgi:hypothetical protein